jgi:Carboxypeptidase regulatory-like domain
MSDRYRLHNTCALILIAVLGALADRGACAQSLQTQPGAASLSLQNAAPTQALIQPDGAASVTPVELPNAPGARPADPQATERQSGGAISGTVLDTRGAEVAGARVTLEINGSSTPRTMATDGNGFFQFDAVEPGTFKLTVSSPGFASWVATDLVLLPGQRYEMPPIALEVAPLSTNVEAVSPHEVAEEQMLAQEKQRVLGVFPNFYVTYVRNAAPLSSGQKFRLALRSSIDPVSIGISGVVAGVEQWQNDFSGYGQGAQGYAKRFGASYADGVISTMLGDAVLPSILHQDPRYFYKGTGSIPSRALYAIGSVVICKGDNGHWQPNYSNVFGNLAAAGISNLYYPSTDRDGVGLTISNSLIGTASSAIGALFQEFLVKKISRGIQP